MMTAIWTVVGAAFVAANRLGTVSAFSFYPKEGRKRAWQRWLEWSALYGVTAALAIGVERKFIGRLFSPGAGFYVVTLCLFLVLALPGLFSATLSNIISNEVRHLET